MSDVLLLDLTPDVTFGTYRRPQKEHENAFAKSFVGDQEGRHADTHMLIHTSLVLQGSGSRDWKIRPRKNRGELYGRRQAIRFPIRLPVRYQAGGESGWGEIVNISSRRALFTTDRDLALDACVEMYIKWPVLLDNSVQLSLIASGTIVRIETGRAALAIEKYEFRTCVPSFFQRSQPWQMPGHAAPAQQSPSESRMAHLQVRHPGTSGAAGRLECPERELTGECALLQRRPGRRAGVGREISNGSHGRKGEINDARWERVFQEKFADPEYYSFRLLSHSSPTVDL